MLLSKCYFSPNFTTKINVFRTAALFNKWKNRVKKGILGLGFIPNSYMCGYLHEEIIWLDISVYKVLAVYEFDARDELIGQQKHCFEAKSSWAEVEQIFQWGAK